MRCVAYEIAKSLDRLDVMARAKRRISEAAILYYLLWRQEAELGPATREEMLDDLDVHPNTLGSALKRLKDDGVISRREAYEPTPQAVPESKKRT